MEDHRFDQLARSLAQPVSRRHVLKVLAGTAVGGIFASRLTPAWASNSTCAHFCNQVFGENTPAAEQCTMDRSLCSSACGPGGGGGTLCGPQSGGYYTSYSGTTCCAASQCQTCSNGTCVSTCNSSQCQTCSNGTCVSTCAAGTCCNGGTCVSACSGSGCPGCGSVLLCNGTCAKPSTSNSACASGDIQNTYSNGSVFYCTNTQLESINGQTVFCTSDCDCAAGYFCNHSGLCVQATC